MNCDDVKGFLNAYMDGELDPAQRAVVDSHLRECSTCGAFLRDIENVRDTVRDGMEYYRAPVGLREQVRLAIRGTEYLERSIRGGSSRRIDWRVWGAVAATLILSTAIAVPLFLRAGTERQLVAEELLAAHARALMGREVDVISTDRHTVKPWFNGKLPFSPPVADLAADGFPLEGGRLDYAGGEPVAALVYRRALHRIDVFVWPSTGGGVTPTQFDRDGYHEVSWTKAGFVFAAVSDLNPPDLNRFAELLKTR